MRESAPSPSNNPFENPAAFSNNAEVLRSNESGELVDAKGNIYNENGELIKEAPRIVSAEEKDAIARLQRFDKSIDPRTAREIADTSKRIKKKRELDLQSRPDEIIELEDDRTK